MTSDEFDPDEQHGKEEELSEDDEARLAFELQEMKEHGGKVVARCYRRNRNIYAETHEQLFQKLQQLGINTSDTQEEVVIEGVRRLGETEV